MEGLVHSDAVKNKMMEDIGTLVNHPDDFSKLRNKYINDSVFFLMTESLNTL